MVSVSEQEQVKFRIMPHLHNIELLTARYINHSFSKHIHEGYGLGVIEQGALTFSYRGERVVAPAGYINLVIPGEAHDGHAATELGWSYRMFYLESSILEQVVYDLSGKAHILPFFKAGTIKDDSLARFIRDFHQLLENNDVPLLEQQTLLLILLTELITRHADDHVALKGMGRESLIVAQARDYIEGIYNSNFSLSNLARHCNISPYHLLRVFKDAIGVPPHVYLKQVRIRRAKKLLEQGMSLSLIAQEVGFADQSHFSRQFKQITGLTPGKYSNIVQDIYPIKE